DGLTHAAVRVADPDVLGAPDGAPFDRILVSAMASELPTELVDQLAPDGLMVLPLGGRMVLVRRGVDGPEVETAPGSYLFVPLQTAGRRGRRWPWRRDRGD